MLGSHPFAFLGWGSGGLQHGRDERPRLASVRNNPRRSAFCSQPNCCARPPLAPTHDARVLTCCRYGNDGDGTYPPVPIIPPITFSGEPSLCQR